GDVGRLAVGADSLHLLDDRPGAGVHHHNVALARLGVQYAEEAVFAIEGEAEVEGGRVLALPLGIAHERLTLPFPRVVAIAHGEHGDVVGPQVVHDHEVVAGRVESGLVDRVEDLRQHDLVGVRVAAHFLDGQVAFRGRNLGTVGFPVTGVEEENRLPVVAVEDDHAAAHARGQDRPPPRRVVDGVVQARQGGRRVAGYLAALDEQFGHRHHFPVDLVALGALEVVLAAFLRLGQSRESELAALFPGVSQVGRVGDPIGSKGHLHLGLLAGAASPGEEGDNVFLPVANGEAGAFGVDTGVDAKANPRGFGNV